jgi:hypothetical protein
LAGLPLLFVRGPLLDQLGHSIRQRSAEILAFPGTVEKTITTLVQGHIRMTGGALSGQDHLGGQRGILQNPFNTSELAVNELSETRGKAEVAPCQLESHGRRSNQ